MSVIRGLIIAFSIYSKIPVPIFRWEDEDMKYHLIFFPWIGAVIGFLLCGWRCVADYFLIGQTAYVMVGFAIPIIVTGGFHLDGYMDTVDALKSYKSKEDKLSILKDPHIGAFAVISLLMLSAVYIGAISLISVSGLVVFSSSFIASRCLSAVAVLTFPNAKKDGMLHTFSATGSKAKSAVLFFIVTELIMCMAYMLYIDLVFGVAVIVTLAVSMFYYRYRMIKEFGGITGDTAGYFVTVTETLCAVVVAVVSVVLNVI
ncbi:MAG: adenosylcobinamide-GDP ribazoletransferase [Lachnospiraceae bacterium]|nr:adenosylcobinamide-GDP ribazoletransferase [Lachnospiraceae bacterium]